MERPGGRFRMAAGMKVYEVEMYKVFADYEAWQSLGLYASQTGAEKAVKAYQEEEEKDGEESSRYGIKVHALRP
jgi:hypothetical protein